MCIRDSPTSDEEKITDVKVVYDEEYMPQMLRYSKEYSPLTK